MLTFRKPLSAGYNWERTRAEAVLEKIYFYSGKFGLAFDYNKGKYGFIDKNLNTKIPFIYDEASSFEINGFSKVSKNGCKYLIDTFGVEYRLATFVHELSDSIDAVDFGSQNIQIFPPDIFKCKNLKILLISDNKLTDIPQRITENKNLRYCDISNNNISTLPSDFGNNQDLQIDIAGNPLLSNKLTGKVAAQYDNINRLIVYDQFGELTERIKNDSGTIYLLYFWATWCSPCIKELPFFDLLNNELNQPKTKILLVSLDFTSRMEKNLIPFLKRTNLKSEVVLLADQDADDWIPKICPDWDGSIPFTILLKATGESKYHNGNFDTYFDLLNWFRS